MTIKLEKSEYARGAKCTAARDGACIGEPCADGCQAPSGIAWPRGSHHLGVDYRRAGPRRTEDAGRHPHMPVGTYEWLPATNSNRFVTGIAFQRWPRATAKAAGPA